MSGTSDTAHPLRWRGDLIYVLTLVGLLSGMLMSLPLWLTERTYPHLPCAGFPGPWSQPYDALLLAGTMLALGLSVFLPARRSLICAGMAGLLLLATQDMMRWQPWFYQYVLMVGFAAVVGDRAAPPFLLCCRILFVCLYAWSGIHKFHPAYSHMYDMTFAEPLAGLWPGWAAEVVRRSAPLGPWMEILLAAMLLAGRTRRIAVVGICGLHLWILLMIGPAGTSTNAVVWPWNVLMPVMTVLLFWHCRAFGWASLRTLGHRCAAAGSLVLCGLMPVFSISGRWDRYLSFHLYSGSERRIMAVLDGQAAAALPAEWQPWLTDSPQPGFKELRPFEWGLKELRVPAPGDERYLLSLARRWARMDFVKRGEVQFYTDYPFQVKTLGWDLFSPEEILQMKKFPPLRRKME